MHDESLTDEDLVARANAGLPDALEALYERYRDWVLRLAYRLCGDRDMALDVLQETFLYFLKKFPGFQLRARMSTFLYPVVRNLTIAARRKAERYVHAPDVLHMRAANEEHDAVCSRGDLAEALGALPAAAREALLLRYADGLSLEETAQAVGVPLGTVKSRIHNALKVLRQDPRTRSYFEK